MNQLLQRLPKFTALICIIYVLVALGFRFDDDASYWERFSTWGSPHPIEVWNGKFWAPFTASFLHYSWYGLGQNVVWLVLFGGAIERTIGSMRWALFYGAAAFTSYMCQMAIGGTGGYGASGVISGCIAFTFVARKQIPAFAKVTRPWILAIFALTELGTLVSTLLGNLTFWEVAHVAHFVGYLFGGLCGTAFILPRSHAVRIAICAVQLFAVTTLFWVPWQAGWFSAKAIQAEWEGRTKDAEQLYNKALERGEDLAWVWERLGYVYQKQGSDDKYQCALQTLRKIDNSAALRLENARQQRLERPAEASLSYNLSPADVAVVNVEPYTNQFRLTNSAEYSAQLYLRLSADGAKNFELFHAANKGKTYQLRICNQPLVTTIAGSAAREMWWYMKTKEEAQQFVRLLSPSTSPGLERGEKGRIHQGTTPATR